METLEELRARTIVLAQGEKYHWRAAAGTLCGLEADSLSAIPLDRVSGKLCFACQDVQRKLEKGW